MGNKPKTHLVEELILFLCQTGLFLFPRLISVKQEEEEEEEDSRQTKKVFPFSSSGRDTQGG